MTRLYLIALLCIGYNLQAQDFNLQIIHSNGGKSNYFSTDIGGTVIGGIAEFATALNELKADNISSITLSAGDNIFEGEAFNANIYLPSVLPLYESTALDVLNYDAICIGNNELDFGPDFFERMLTDMGSGTPFLSSNLDFSGEPGLQALVNANRIAKSTILDVDGEQVGIVGVTTPALPFVSSPRNIDVSDLTFTKVQDEVDAMTAAGINKIILVSHLQSLDEISMMAGFLKDIDVIVSGGSDELLTNDPGIALPSVPVSGSYPLPITDYSGNTVYIVGTPGKYQYLGNLVVTFNSNGVVTNIDANSDVKLVTGYEPDQFMQQFVVDHILDYVNTQDSRIAATTAVDLDGSRPNIRIMETNEGNLVADALLWQAQQLATSYGIGSSVPMIAIQNAGGIRNNSVIPAGTDISEATTFDILSFSNFLAVTNPIPPEILKIIFENAVSRVESQNSRFLQIAGIEFIWDEDGEADENRVYSLTLDDGTKIVDNYEVVPGAPAVLIATNNFISNGGDSYGEIRDAGYTLLGTTYQQALYNYLTNALGNQITSTDYPEGGEGRIRTLSSVGVEDQNPTLSEGSISPNPPDNLINIGYTLLHHSPVTISILDHNGRLIKKIFNGNQTKGQYSFTENVQYLAKGMYLVNINTSRQQVTYQFTKI